MYRRFLRHAAGIVLAAGVLVLGPGADGVAADVVGTGYVDTDLVDLQWATDHLGYDSVGELQRAGVAVVRISGRESQAAFASLSDAELKPRQAVRTVVLRVL